MSDTVKIARPKFPRRPDGPKGRVEHDDRGNAIWVRSRAEDSADIAAAPDLSLEDAPAPMPAGQIIDPRVPGKRRR